MEGSLNERPSLPRTDVKRGETSQTKEHFSCITWDDLRAIVETNKLAVLKRTPSEISRYRQWTTETVAEYGSVVNYLLAHRLPKMWGTPPFTPLSSIPFEDPSDYRVLLNDWPYGFPQNITHMIVWTRTPIQTDSDRGDITPESRKLIEGFIERYFTNRLGHDAEHRVIWFKNWVALQSVKTLEHIHVLVRDVDPSLIEEWTREQK
ncbi:hypothetical protein BGZ60DRAFT_528925 [Tricladium varicosporioides]|nr:hypothetical protein BGZ60DRAFT_528925 [Hymenoscyphus varicosporioides]